MYVSKRQYIIRWDSSNVDTFALSVLIKEGGTRFGGNSVYF